MTKKIEEVFFILANTSNMQKKRSQVVVTNMILNYRRYDVIFVYNPDNQIFCGIVLKDKDRICYEITVMNPCTNSDEIEEYIYSTKDRFMILSWDSVDKIVDKLFNVRNNWATSTRILCTGCIEFKDHRAGSQYYISCNSRTFDFDIYIIWIQPGKIFRKVLGRGNLIYNININGIIPDPYILYKTRDAISEFNVCYYDDISSTKTLYIKRSRQMLCENIISNDISNIVIDYIFDTFTPLAFFFNTSV